MKAVKFVIGALLILGTANQPNFGFVSPANAEALGMLSWAIFAYGLGAWLVYSALKKAS